MSGIGPWANGDIYGSVVSSLGIRSGGDSYAQVKRAMATAPAAMMSGGGAGSGTTIIEVKGPISVNANSAEEFARSMQQAARGGSPLSTREMNFQRRRELESA
jgi:hypothetical protein